MMIAVVSVTGVVAAWRATQLQSDATDKRRELLQQTVVLEQTAARVESQLASDREAFAHYRIEEMTARELDEEAVSLRRRGLSGDAVAVDNEARTRHDLAERLLGIAALGTYVSAEGSAVPSFQEDRRRRDLFRETAGAEPTLNPDQTTRQANGLTDRSQRLVGWIMAFAFVGLLLTIAQVTRRERGKRALAAVAAGAYVMVTAVTFLGDRA